MARRLLGNFTPETLVQVLDSMPRLAVSMLKTRGGPRKSDLSKGRGGQTNGVETMSVMQEKGSARNSPIIRNDNN